MSTPVKTIQPDPLPTQLLTAGTSVFSSVIGVSTALSARFFVDCASIATGSTIPPRLEIQVSEKDSDNDAWVVAKEFLPPLAALTSGSSFAFQAAVLAGDFTFITANPIWAVPKGAQCLFFKDPAVFVDSEWNQLLTRSGTTNTMRDAFDRPHVITTTLAYRATRHTFRFDLTAIRRLRVAFHNNDTIGALVPRNFAIRVTLITTDSLS